MLAAMGVFPVSVLVGGVIVHRLGTTPFFPLAAGFLAAAILAGLTQRSCRDFGSPSRSAPAGRP